MVIYSCRKDTNAIKKEVIEMTELKRRIKEQQDANTKLYNIFENRIYDKEMQTFVDEWRAGSRKLKEMLTELKELELKEVKNSPKKFVNSYGEATSREITTSTYARADKRLQKQIMSFLS